MTSTIMKYTQLLISIVAKVNVDVSANLRRSNLAESNSVMCVYLNWYQMYTHVSA